MVTQKEIHLLAVEKGFYALQRQTEEALSAHPELQAHVRNTWLAARIALIHSELSEALEEIRAGRPHVYYLAGAPHGLGIELADAAIRLRDLLEGACGMELADLEDIKHTYNQSRPHTHGGKAL